jgi:hypothetical protein
VAVVVAEQLLLDLHKKELMATPRIALSLKLAHNNFPWKISRSSSFSSTTLLSIIPSFTTRRRRLMTMPSPFSAQRSCVVFVTRVFHFCNIRSLSPPPLPSRPSASGAVGFLSQQQLMHVPLHDKYCLRL